MTNASASPTVFFLAVNTSGFVCELILLRVLTQVPAGDVSEIRPPTVGARSGASFSILLYPDQRFFSPL
jgi:hypothetical protein